MSSSPPDGFAEVTMSDWLDRVSCGTDTGDVVQRFTVPAKYMHL